MKISDLLIKLRALAAEYGYQKVTLSAGFTIWEHEYKHGAQEGEYSASIHLPHRCHTMARPTVEELLAGLEAEISKDEHGLPPVEVFNPKVEDPQFF